MALNLLANIHPDSATGVQPLPMRETDCSTAVGHAVYLHDWSLLLELLMVRQYANYSERFDVYPDKANIQYWGGLMNLHDAANALEPYNTVAADNVRRSRVFIDPEWDFASERFEALSGYPFGAYDPFDFCHGLPLSRTPMTTSTPRTLDALRRRYYDVKRCNRVVAATNRLTFTENWNHGYGFNAVGTNPREYDWGEGSVGGVSYDASTLYHPSVTAHSAFRATPVKILGCHHYYNGNAQSASDRDYYRTVWLPITNGVVDTTGITKAKCRDAYEAEFGAGPTGDGSSFVGGYIWLDGSNRPLVVCDMTFPLWETMRDWTWAPT